MLNFIADMAVAIGGQHFEKLLRRFRGGPKYCDDAEVGTHSLLKYLDPLHKLFMRRVVG
ncbi:hypothetical protein [Rhizobium sp. 16-556-2B]